MYTQGEPEKCEHDVLFTISYVLLIDATEMSERLSKSLNKVSKYVSITIL